MPTSEDRASITDTIIDHMETYGLTDLLAELSGSTEARPAPQDASQVPTAIASAKEPLTAGMFRQSMGELTQAVLQLPRMLSGENAFPPIERGSEAAVPLTQENQRSFPERSTHTKRRSPTDIASSLLGNAVSWLATLEVTW